MKEIDEFEKIREQLEYNIKELISTKDLLMISENNADNQKNIKERFEIQNKDLSREIVAKSKLLNE